MSTMKFCRECNNILYPKEDREQKILLFACRNCDHQGNPGSHCVRKQQQELSSFLAVAHANHESECLIMIQEPADNNCVYRNEVIHAVAEQTQVLQDVAADPTLPRTKEVQCPLCKHPEAVFFQATARGEEGMTLFFVCCNPNCGHRWRE